MSDNTIVISTGALRRVLLAILAVPLIAGLLFVVYQQRERFPLLASGAASYIDEAGYQAVFLTSSQVFFGRLRVAGSEFYLMSDVYYLNTPPQGEQAGQLLKRGGELHGPREPMIIPADKVLFIENVRPDSEVMNAIRRFQRGETPAPAPTPRPSPTR
ncbi:MAG TPA: hypothetical protein VFM93_07845 [Candidatus Limnocylindria bacterium]|nr:hypothetical protein [Candidatus Limnocylindria bacterium]